MAALDRQRILVNGRLRDQLERVSQDIRLMSVGYASFNIVNPLLDRPAPQTLAAADKISSPTALFSKIVTKVFGYDKTFLITETGELAINADIDTARRYKWIKPLLRPMLQELQKDSSKGQDPAAPAERSGGEQQPPTEDTDRSIVEMMRVEGRPSIVGVVGVKQKTNRDQADAAEARPPMLYLIAIRFLDGAALDALSREQGLIGARFARSLDADKDEVAFPIEATATKAPIGFIVWKPDLPGSRVVQRLVPALSAAALMIAVLFTALMARLRRSMKKLEASEQNARHLAHHDVLTELPNRAMFASRLDRCVADMRMHGKRAAVALIDLDRFKAVNDTFGHAAGDELIRIAASRMRGVIGSQDTLARIGGDEFALLLTDIDDADTGYRQILDAIVAEISQSFSLQAGQAVAHIGCSIGVAILADATQTASELLRSADVALYQVKTGGRGRWLTFDPSMDKNKQARDSLKNQLRVVLEPAEPQRDDVLHDLIGPMQSEFGSLELFFQTVHRAGGGDQVSGAEALVRWRHSRYGLLSPDRFISIAEENGLIHQLGHWVLREACRVASLWPVDTFIAVNVSPTQLRRATFEADVLAVLEETGLHPSRLELELTESSLFQIDEEAHAALARLRGAGVKVALDDFGTGFSSLSHLIHIGIDRVKIDRSFVGLMGTQAKGAAIVSAVVGLARDLGLSTTAEGVETELQRDFLVALGCSDLQGYLFSKPLPFSEVMPLICPEPIVKKIKA